MEAFTAFLASEFVQWVIGGAVAATAYYYSESIQTAKSRDGLAAALREGSAGARYRAYLRNALDAVDARLSPDALTLPATHWRRAWTPQLFEFSLSLALLYPAVAVLAFWALTPSDGRFGANFVFLEPFDDPWIGVAAMAAFLLAMLLTGQARRMRRRGEPLGEFAWLSIAVTVIIAGVFIVLSVNSSIGGGKAFLSTAVIVSVGAAASVALAGALAGAAAMAISALIAFAAALFLGIQADGAVGGADLETLQMIAGGVFGAGLLGLGALAAAPVGEAAQAWARGVVLRSVAFVIGVGLGCVIGLIATGLSPDFLVVGGLAAVVGSLTLTGQLIADGVRALGRRMGASFFAFLAYTIALFLLLFAILQVAPIDQNISAYLLFFAFLPLLNALFDYFSIGATRWALRNGLDEEGGALPIVWSGYDVLAAVALFTLLGVACVATFHFAQGSNGAPLLPLGEFFADLRADPSNYGWVYFTFVSTLAPTFIHFSVACFSLVGAAPRRFTDWLTRKVEEGGDDGSARGVAVMVLTLLTALALFAPIFLFCLVVFALASIAGQIGTAYITIFEGLASILP